MVKLTVVLIIAILTKTIEETALLILFYAGIRTFSYGIHAKSNIACWITTLIMYNGFPYIISTITIPKLIGYIILAVALISMILWAPADTPKRPLIRKKHRLKCKILSCLIVLIYTIIFSFNNISIINNAMLFALIIQMLIINPLTYKITNTQFNNYKYYKKNI